MAVCVGHGDSALVGGGEEGGKRTTEVEKHRKRDSDIRVKVSS